MGSSRFARRYSGNRFFFLFLQVLRCFSSLGLPLRRYVFTSKYCSIKNSGFPHSEISGSKLTYSSPKHIGVSAVLLRLLVPRHPPCALSNLTNGQLKSCGQWPRVHELLAYNVSMSSYPVFKEQVRSSNSASAEGEPSKLNAKRQPRENPVPNSSLERR